MKKAEVTMDKGAAAPEEATLSEELEKMGYEPLLPVEKKLISWSLILGVALLGLLVLISYKFFPAGH
ncbi:MAG: hypothetical protein Kow0025_11530 [Thermodesulfovibrionales bacterium]